MEPDISQEGGVKFTIKKTAAAPQDSTMAAPVVPTAAPVVATAAPIVSTTALPTGPKSGFKLKRTVPLPPITPSVPPAPAPIGDAAPAEEEEAEEPIITQDGIVPTSAQLRDFYAKRVGKPHLYEFDARGNLVIKSPTGRVEKVYTIPPYYPPTREDLEQLDVQRREDVRALEAQYDTAVDALRAAYDAYKTGVSTALQVKLANDAVEALDIKRTRRQYELQTLVVEDSVPVQSILFHKEHGVLNLHSVGFVRRRPYKLQTEYARVGQERIPAPQEVVPAATAAEPEVGAIDDLTLQGGAARKRGFMTDVAKAKKIVAYAGPTDNEFGYLSTFYPVEFTMDRVKYFTVEQAVAAEKARRFHYDDLRTEIMKTRAPRTMRTKANGIIPKPITQTHGAPSPRLDEWENKIRLDILEEATYEKFRQHTELREKLLGTGNATIVLADSAEKVDGIGLALDNEGILNSAKWRGENKYGKILMSVRKRLLKKFHGGADEDEVAAFGVEDTEADKTVIGAGEYAEQTAKAREGAIIGHFANARRVNFA